MLALLLLPFANAGERFFAWSYGAATVPVGEVELEPISTVETHAEDGATVAEWTHEVELEYGITPALEAGFYLVTSQEGDAPLTFSGYKGRLRYRFWPIGTRGVDLAAYLEYVGSPTFSEHTIEAKVIVAHEGKKLRASLNVTGEFEVAEGGVEPTLEPTAGVAWRISPNVAVGAEGKLEATFGDTLEGPFIWAGPTLHLAGKDAAVWWTVSALVGLTGPSREDATVEARSMVGIDL